MPATQSAAASPASNPVQARHQNQPNARSATPATQNEGGRLQVPRLPRETKAHIKDGGWQRCVWQMVVCDRWLCVKDGVWQDRVGRKDVGWQRCAWKICVWKMVVDKDVCERLCVKDGGWQRCVGGAAEEEEERRDTESKTRTPHKDVGENK